ncbi:hypothetical protein [Ferrovibrio sp.]|uniref:hypothetical protein n=1 Tax=Ferrovibrio sp. TaxID=1917215 RepID=UPI001B730A14|nr:hypothetical protein [Ferrovibrio sp.]MBP7066136.1 hypothetical protein [Ferrovibrio sp.]
MPERIAVVLEWRPDWGQDGPWLVLLGLLFGLGLLLLVFELLDRWAARQLSIDRVALAMRYGGFMNSWAVFGRHASDYRDLKPMFPEAEAAEFARFGDGTACIVARFADAAQARTAGSGAFGSFAASGVEADETGLRFNTESRSGGNFAQYALGQWLVAEDTLVAVYGPDAASVARRRRQLPCLKQPAMPRPLLWLRSRLGFSLLCLAWLVLLAGLLLPLLEHSQAVLPPPGLAAQDEAALRARLQALTTPRDGGLLVSAGALPGSLRIERRYDDARFFDALDFGDFGRAVAAIELRLEPASRSVKVLRLTGRLQSPDMAGQPPLPPARWYNLAGLAPTDAALQASLRELVLSQGWAWRPQFLPRPW